MVEVLSEESAFDGAGWVGGDFVRSWQMRMHGDAPRAFLKDWR